MAIISYFINLNQKKMKRILIFLYGVISYLFFFGTFSYLIFFVANLVVPVTIDGEPRVGLAQALITNLALIALFGLQHSIMARKPFKKWLTQFIPQSMERSTFVLLTSTVLSLLMWNWQPIGGVVWNVVDPTAKIALYAASFAGWALVFVATFVIDHFDLFGLRQVYLQLVGKPYKPLQFSERILYNRVRHPLYLGFLIAFWFTPTMTATHLIFSIALTIYILIAIRLEEKDLVHEFGEKYRSYRERVPMLIPKVGKSVPQPSQLEIMRTPPKA
jgi:methanethiol S-methyltransferase